MPGDLHHLQTTSAISRPPPPRHARCPKRGASSWRPPPPKDRDARHTAPPPAPPPTHTGNVGVMTNTSTQPIGNALIDSILHQR